MYGIVYCATNKKNGKRYVGITRRLLRLRIAAHFKDGENLPFGKALRKYGIDKFLIEVIDTAEDGLELSRKEQYWIAHFGCMVPNGYNLTTGGEQTFEVHPSVGRRISASKLGKRRLHCAPMPEDLCGQRFGRLLVKRLESRAPARWICLCGCGNEHSVLATALKGGKNRSCGCLRREVTSSRKRTTYEHRHTPEYNSWIAMRVKRNHDPRWTDFHKFLADMGKSDGLWLLRKDSSLPFAAENCYWGTRSDCAINMKKTVWIEYQDKRQRQEDWAKELGTTSAAIHKARRRGTFDKLVEKFHA